MTVTIPEFDRLTTMTAAELTQTRSELLAAAESLVTRSADQELSAGDAEEYRNIEKAINQCAHFATLAERNDTPGHRRAAELLAGMGGRVDAPSDRRAVTPIAFSGDQLRTLHDEFMSGHAAQITADVETRAAATAVPMASVTQQQLSPIIFRREPTRIASLIPTVGVTAPTVTFYTQGTAATGAATVAEAAAKPESTPGWSAVVSTVRKIAHYTDVSTEALADFANFEQVVRDEMTRGLIARESIQLLSGNGTAPNLRGILNFSGIQTYAPGSAEARYLSILHAITMLRTGSTFSEPDVILINPSDWEKIASTVATTGELIVTPDPTGAGPGMIWGVPMVLTTGITAGTGIVANMSDAAVVFEREPATIKVDPFSQSVNNVVRFISEERIGLGAIRPAAVVAITFNP